MNNSEQNIETEDSMIDESEHEDAQLETEAEAEASESKVETENDVDQQLEESQQKVAEYHDQMLRMQAEMENLRKRTERDVSNAQKFAVEKFANELLQVKDSLELGLNVYEDAEDIDATKLKEGSELTLKMFSSTFEKFSIEELNPVGEAFDPNLHEAMTMQESEEHEPNIVLTVVQKGYTLHGRLIRPAMVIVSK